MASIWQSYGQEYTGTFLTHSCNWPFFTAWCCASAVFAMALCLCVCLSVCHKSEFCLLTLTLDWVILHTVVHHSSTSTYMPNVIEIKETFCERMYVRMDGRTFETQFFRSTQKIPPEKVVDNGPDWQYQRTDSSQWPGVTVSSSSSLLPAGELFKWMRTFQWGFPRDNGNSRMIIIITLLFLLLSVGLSSAVQLQSVYNANKKLLVIRKPAVKITTDFTIKLK